MHKRLAGGNLSTAIGGKSGKGVKLLHPVEMEKGAIWSKGLVLKKITKFLFLKFFRRKDNYHFMYFVS